MFTAGAGKIGNYSCCAWQVLGEGQFMPLPGNEAYVGKTNAVEKIAEYKVEMVCAENLIDAVISAMKQAHPYEEPAYQVFRIENI
jgi:structural hemagglutinin/hemolysin toxin protein RtxA